MALERNNPAIQFDPGFDPEFEQMLHYHLKRGGAPVAACSGFDADTASAFLENVLSQSTRLQYESHLAGCPACRRQMIELSKLAESCSQIDALSIPAREQQPSVLKGKSGVSEWFNFSDWRWNWRSAGLAGALMTTLIATWSVTVWRQKDRSAEKATPVAQLGDMASSQTSSIAGGANQLRVADGNSRFEEKERSINRPSATPNPRPAALSQEPPLLPSPSSDQTLDKQVLPLRRSMLPVSVSPKPGGPVLVSDAARGRIEMKSSSAMDLQFSTPPTAPTPHGQTNSPAPVSAESNRPPADVFDATPRSANLVDLQVSASPDDNPMRTDRGEVNKDSSRQPSTANQQPVKLDLKAAFVPERKAARNDKTEAVQANEEDFKALITHINGRTFTRENRIEGGIWVDQEYNRLAWRGLTQLVQGTNEYERVLKTEPQLQPFFEKAPIIVVWRDRIYKVVLKIGGVMLRRNTKGSQK